MSKSNNNPISIVSEGTSASQFDYNSLSGTHVLEGYKDMALRANGIIKGFRELFRKTHTSGIRRRLQA